MSDPSTGTSIDLESTDSNPESRITGLNGTIVAFSRRALMRSIRVDVGSKSVRIGWTRMVNAGRLPDAIRGKRNAIVSGSVGGPITAMRPPSRGKVDFRKCGGNSVGFSGAPSSLRSRSTSPGQWTSEPERIEMCALEVKCTTSDHSRLARHVTADRLFGCLVGILSRLSLFGSNLSQS